MALQRELVPRGMQLSLNCTLLAAMDLTREKWEGILSEASMKLVQLAHDHYTHQLEVEKTIQGQTLSTLKKITQPWKTRGRLQSWHQVLPLREQDKHHGRGRGMTPPLQKNAGIPTRGVRTDSKSRNQEQNCTVQDKDTLHKEKGEKEQRVKKHTTL